jgi:hypothetical protein
MIYLLEILSVPCIVMLFSMGVAIYWRLRFIKAQAESKNIMNVLKIMEHNYDVFTEEILDPHGDLAGAIHRSYNLKYFLSSQPEHSEIKYIKEEITHIISQLNALLSNIIERNNRSIKTENIFN